MAKITRHIGRYKNLNRKLVVVFRKIQDDPTHCLVVETESLSDMYHDNLMSVVNSTSAQNTVDLENVLYRTSFGDGSNILNTLHNRGYLKKVPVEDVIMTPMPSYPVSLKDINAQIDGGETETPATEVDDNYVKAEPSGEGVDEQMIIAKSLLEQARLLKQDASMKEEEAYKLCPELKSVKPGRPKLTDDQKMEAREKRNAKKREKYSKEKQKKAKEDLENKVTEKILRDSGVSE